MKEQATAALDATGLSVSDAVRIFLKRVIADQAFPLELKVPNKTTRAAIMETDEIATREGRGSKVAHLAPPSIHHTYRQDPFRLAP